MPRLCLKAWNIAVACAADGCRYTNCMQRRHQHCLPTAMPRLCLKAWNIAAACAADSCRYTSCMQRRHQQCLPTAMLRLCLKAWNIAAACIAGGNGSISCMQRRHQHCLPPAKAAGALPRRHQHCPPTACGRPEPSLKFQAFSEAQTMLQHVSLMALVKSCMQQQQPHRQPIAKAAAQPK
eukprot:1144021-Pelagomonas_calceolata.AAC.6